MGGLPAWCCVARGRRALCRQRSWQASRPACGVWFSSCGPVPGDLASAELKLRASPSSLRKQGTGSQLPGPRLLFLSVPALWAGSEQYRPAGQSRGQAAPAPRAALLAPHGCALCTGAVSWKPWRWLWGLVVGFSSSNHPREWRGAVQERCAVEVQQQQASFVLKALVSACLGAP